MKWQGKGVSEGLAMAELRVFLPKLPEISREPAAEPEAEVQRFGQTLAAAKKELQALYEDAKAKMGEKEAEIFDAHLTMLEDEYSVAEPIVQRIREQKQNAAAAIDDQFEELAEMFRSLGDELMAERAADAEDLKNLLLRICLGCGRQDLSGLDRDVIVLAEELTPSDTVRMDTAHVKGIVTRLGGATAHSAIIARTLGIPAIAGLDGWQEQSLNGQMTILNGTTGVLITDPDAAEQEAYRAQRAAADAEEEEVRVYRNLPSQTADGMALELCANIGTPQEAQQAMAFGADGVGLFRSEFLFMDRSTLPTEDEQFEAYRKAAQTMAGKPLIIRTLDVGGDKKLPTLDLPKEDNPFLGFRAVRMTLKKPEIFRPQLRAILRAAAYGDVRVMFPMIGSLEQLRAAKAMLAEQAESLRAEGVQTGAVKVGMMVEIPAAAILAEEFAKEVDFFSIGTNDLTQYTLAVERGNNAVAEIYEPQHPAVLKLIAMTGAAAAKQQIPCGMCGEAAGDLRLAPAFVGMGVNELSMSPRRVPAVRRLLRGLTMEDCRTAARTLLAGK